MRNENQKADAGAQHMPVGGSETSATSFHPRFACKPENSGRSPEKGLYLEDQKR